ncbi:MAG: hypothetical protein AAF530_17045 [Pseudomonadota bacterium]
MQSDPCNRPSRFLVTGGQQNRAQLQKLAKFNLGVASTIDLERASVSRTFDYKSSDENAPPKELDMNFTAGSVCGDEVIIPTTTELLIYDKGTLSLKGVISHPIFNDVHHVVRDYDQSFLVASTGLDGIARIDTQGKLVEEWSVLEQSVWDHFDSDTDYRKKSTKPHRSHPNYVFRLDEEIWATRFRQKDAICLTNRSKRIPLDIEKPHDGVVFGKHVYFTIVSGYVVQVDIESLDVTKVYDLNQMNMGAKALGWCRSIAPLGNEEFLVGFSRLRPTLLRQNITWISERFFSDKLLADSFPTRVVHYDLKAMKVIREYNLEDLNMAVVFSILPLG